MEPFNIIKQLAGQSRTLGIFLQQYSSFLVAGGLVFSLLNCFFGFRLRKLWSVIAGFLAGAALGMGFCVYFAVTRPLFLLLAIGGGGLLCGLLAFFLYRLGLFFMCAGATVFVLYRLMTPSDTVVLAVCLALGAVVGFLALARERLTISLATAIGGGWGTAEFLLLLLHRDSPILLILLTLVLAFLGILAQLKPWKSRDYWDEKDAAYRKERRMERRKKKRKEKRKKRAEKKKRRKEKNLSSPSQTPRRAQPEPPKASQPEPPRASRPDLSPAPLPADPPSDGGNPLDLSDVRQQLSREVSEIYQEEQPASDTADTPKDQIH